MTEFDTLATEDLLRLPSAAPKAVRGGAVRVVGYLFATALGTLAAVFLLRYLGVVDFGRYVTVMSLIAIVSGFTDVGLSLIGQREYVLRPTTSEKEALLANILGIRLVLTPVGVALAALFAIVAGYETTLVLGTLVAGVGLMFLNAALTLAIPLAANLRFVTVTVIEIARQFFTVVGTAVLVVAGADLIAFFGVYVFASMVGLLLTLTVMGTRSALLPRFDRFECAGILREAAPMGAALVVEVLYVRGLIVLISLLGTGYQTGLFATSSRILEALLNIPALMILAAFPILAMAGSEDDARLAYGLQRLVEISLLLAGLLVLILVIGAEPIVRILGGSQYVAAAPVVRIQAFSLLASCAAVVWTTGLVAVRRQSALVMTNVAALATMLVLGPLLIPWLGAKGAALATVLGDAFLAAAALVMLVRARQSLKPNLRFGLRILPAGALGAACVLIPALPDLATAAIAALVYCAAAWILGAVPADAINAFASQWRIGSR